MQPNQTENTATLSSKQLRRRNWLFTINNPEQTEEALLGYLKGLLHVKYVVFGREKGEKGTEHYQGYIEFSEPKDFGTIKNIFSEPNVKPNAHIDPRKGTRIQARDYILKVNDYADKADTRMGDIYEHGTFTKNGERSDIYDIMDSVKEGMTGYALAEKYGARFAKYEQFAEKYRQNYLEERFGNEPRMLNVVYLWGKAGSGKTRHVMERHGFRNVYRFSNYARFGHERFDGYRGQEVIVFEEFRSGIPISNMLNYLDIYPLTLPARYQDRIACYTKVYIISNISIDKQYTKTQETEPETWVAFKRRIHEIREFPIKEKQPEQLSFNTNQPATGLLSKRNYEQITQIDKNIPFAPATDVCMKNSIAEGDLPY
ncbi:MAG: replication protein [Firmicutes bacterium]|nr:replication protein [Bacillota bacterium]